MAWLAYAAMSGGGILTTTARKVLKSSMDAYERRTGFYGIGRFFEELGIIRLIDPDSIKTEGSPVSEHMLGGTSSQGSDLSISTGIQKDFSSRKVAAHGSL